MASFGLGNILTGDFFGLTKIPKNINKQNEFSVLFDPGDLLGREKAKEKKRLRAIQQKKDRLELARQGAETIRKSQVERATLLQQAENSGVSDSSAVQGGLGSVQSQVGANLGFANQIFNLNSLAADRLKKLDNINARTKLAMTVGSFFIGGIGAAAAGAASSGGFGDSGGVDFAQSHTNIANQQGVV